MLRTWIVFASVALPSLCGAQQALAARDSTALIQSIVGDLRSMNRAFADGEFVLDTTGIPLGVVAAQVVLTLRSDKALVVTRTTARAHISDVRISGDTASLDVSVSRCRLEPREWISGTSETRRYVRVNGNWEPQPRRAVAVGDGMGCPH